MTLAPNSMGWGHGPFGNIPFGEGPWITLTTTPGFSHITQAAYDVGIHQFDDLTEQRILRNRLERRQIEWQLHQNDSATLGTIQSWFIAAGGRAERFIVLDHQEATFYAVRFGADAIERLRGPALVGRMGKLTFDIEHEVTYEESILSDGPLAYWRFGETGTHSATDQVGSSHFGYVNSGLTAGVGGALLNDSNAGLATGSAAGHLSTAIVTSVLNVRTHGMTWEAWVLASVSANRTFFDMRQNDATNGIVLATQSGNIQAVFNNAVTLIASGTIDSGGYHHVGVRVNRPAGSPHFMDAYLDGAFAGSISLTGHSGNLAVTSHTTMGTSAQPFEGQIDELAVYSGALDTVRLREHYLTGMRVRV